MHKGANCGKSALESVVLSKGVCIDDVEWSEGVKAHRILCAQKVLLAGPPLVYLDVAFFLETSPHLGAHFAIRFATFLTLHFGRCRVPSFSFALLGCQTRIRRRKVSSTTKLYEQAEIVQLLLHITGVVIRVVLFRQRICLLHYMCAIEYVLRWLCLRSECEE